VGIKMSCNMEDKPMRTMGEGSAMSTVTIRAQR
jgi:hypothetical protein